MLHAHHIERDPDGMDEHALENLTTVCRPCHNWIHERATVADAPVELTDGDLTELLPQDFEILRVLAREGPARTGAIASALTADLTVTAVRERLWTLMGLDHEVQGRESALVDKDVQSGQWGFPGDIETSARGHIPSDPRLLVQRVEDEQVRRALARGCDRQAVMDVLGVSRRSTFYKETRAQAYDFPLDAFNRGGRPPTQTPNTQSEARAGSDGQRAPGQQGLDDATPDAEGDLGRVETWGTEP